MKTMRIVVRKLSGCFSETFIIGSGFMNPALSILICIFRIRNFVVVCKHSLCHSVFIYFSPSEKIENYIIQKD